MYDQPNDFKFNEKFPRKQHWGYPVSNGQNFIKLLCNLVVYSAINASRRQFLLVDIVGRAEREIILYLLKTFVLRILRFSLH